MRLELLDEPVLLINSVLEVEDSSLQNSVLQKIESFLEDEIELIKDQISSQDDYSVETAFVSFNMHLQLDNKINSIILESEWNQQLEFEQESDADEKQDIKQDVSDLMRIVKIIYDDMNLERKSIYKWLSEQEKVIPFIHGLSETDYLLLPAKEIFKFMSSLQSIANI